MHHREKMMKVASAISVAINISSSRVEDAKKHDSP